MPELFVSETGNDLNSGTHTSPLLTVGGAIRRGRGRDFMSSLRIRTLPGTLRGGDNVLFPSDSGVSFETATGEPGSTIISGATVLGGWEPVGGGIYRAPYVSAACPIRTLFEDGIRARAARYPKLAPGAGFPCSFAPYFTSLTDGDPHFQIAYDVGQYDPTGWDVQQAQVFVWSGGHRSWFTDRIDMFAVNAGLRLLGFQPGSRYAIQDTVEGSRYFVQNVLEFLTEPGEFYVNRTHIYYMFAGDPETAVIEIPTAYDIFNLRGTQSSPVTDVVFDGLAAKHTQIPAWYRHAHINEGEGFTDRERGPLDDLASSDQYDRQMTLRQNRHGLINLNNCDAIQINACHLSDSGLSAIYASGKNVDHVITNTWLEKTGHSGIYADGPYPGAGDISRGWTVDNVKVNDVGQLIGNGGGFWFINSGHHTIRHVAAARGPRNGFYAGAYTDIPAGNCYSEGILLELSSFDDFCQDSGDVGTVGLGALSSVEGGPIRINTLRQLRLRRAFAHAGMPDVIPNLVFTDNQSREQLMEYIDAADAAGALMRINDSGGHTAIGCTFNADGTVNPDFDPDLMDPTIGLRPTFPF